MFDASKNSKMTSNLPAIIMKAARLFMTVSLLFSVDCVVSCRVVGGDFFAVNITSLQESSGRKTCMVAASAGGVVVYFIVSPYGLVTLFKLLRLRDSTLS